MARWGPIGFFGLFVVYLLAAVSAFDIEAHDAIGQTTASAMDQEAIKQVKRLCGGKDASEIAGWGHQVDDTFPEMERLHFQVHDDFCAPKESRNAQCKDNICLLSAIKHFYGKVLQDEGRTIEYPKIDYNLISPGITFTDADAVKLLINLLGDLHAPLHVGSKADNCGKEVKLRFRGKEMSLYEFWDSGISEAIRTGESNFWLGGWTHISEVRSEFEQEKKLWAELGAFAMFDRWLDENIKFACDVAYKHPKTGKLLAGPAAKNDGVMDIENGDYREWRGEWLKRILIAGARTAIVFNELLDAKTASKLHEGSGVKTKADEAEKAEKEKWERERKNSGAKVAAAVKLHAPSSGSAKVLMMNLGIAAVTVAAFLFVVNFGVDVSAFMAALKSTGGGGSSAGNRAKRFE